MVSNLTVVGNSRVSQGFTLLELLVAMMIFSIMSVMAYSGLANMLGSNEATEQYDKDLEALQRTMLFIDRDFRQMIFRPRRESFSQITPALHSGLDAEGLIEFSRAGNPNPANLARSSLQRIRYTLDDKKLTRLTWNLVDHAEMPALEMLLLQDVEALTFRFYDASSQWQENWGAGVQLALLPVAVEMTLEHQRWGKITRIIPIR